MVKAKVEYLENVIDSHADVMSDNDITLTQEHAVRYVDKDEVFRVLAGELWFIGLLFGGFIIYIGCILVNSKYENIQCRCGKEIQTPNDLTIIFCPNCKEKIELIRENRNCK